MISAKIIKDSATKQGHRITTFELVFPRMILAELNTHRVFSKNSASSRAIPARKMVEMVEKNPFVPLAWQKEHSGMQGIEYHTDPDRIKIFEATWAAAMDAALSSSKALTSVQLTKQLTNRLLEPFMYHKVLLTATEFDNFFNLRCPKYTSDKGEVFKSRKDFKAAKSNDTDMHFYPVSDQGWRNINKSGAEIHMQALAEVMWDEYNDSTPTMLAEGEWHMPYGEIALSELIEAFPYTAANTTIGEHLLNMSIKIASARCARLSYQTLGDNPKLDLQGDVKLHDGLWMSGHMSPFEHCAKAPSDYEYYHAVRGFRTEDNQYDLPNWKPEDYGWFNNFHGMIQYRFMLENSYR